MQATLSDASELRLTEAELQELERLHQAADPAPWTGGDGTIRTKRVQNYATEGTIWDEQAGHMADNFALIVRVRNLLPRLIAAGRRDLQAALERPRLNPGAFAEQAVGGVFPAGVGLTVTPEGLLALADLGQLRANVEQVVAQVEGLYRP